MMDVETALKVADALMHAREPPDWKPVKKYSKYTRKLKVKGGD